MDDKKIEYLKLTKLIDEYLKEYSYEEAVKRAKNKLDYCEWKSSLPSDEREQFEIAFGI